MIVSLSEIQDMSLEDFLNVDKDNLPTFLDQNSIKDEEDYNNFQDYLGFMVEDEDSAKEIRSIEDFSSKGYFFAGFGAVAPVVAVHEGLHALFAKATGGEFYGFGISREGVCTFVSTPSTSSYIATLLGPNVVMSLAGMYLMIKGYREKNGVYAGLGVTAAFSGVNYAPVPRGDFYSAVDWLFGLNHEQTTALTVAAVTLNYLASYVIADYTYSLTEKLSKKEN